MGGVVPFGVSVSGAPSGVTASTGASLVVGVNRTDSGIPTAGFPNGSGFTRYKTKLDGGTYGAETAINTPIVLNGLGQGAHTLSVIGRNDAGFYQDDPRAFGVNAIATTLSWTVDVTMAGDSDGDGLPDAWETTYGLDRMDASDADIDLDGDGASNKLEYVAGTHPRDPTSNLHALFTAVSGEGHVLFKAQPGRSYSVQSTPTLTAPAWSKLRDVSSQLTGHIVDFAEPIGVDLQRFYRVVTPSPAGVGVQSLQRRLKMMPGRRHAGG